jgi:hypothetical protein
MFYLVDSNDKQIREHENKIALRRICRKSPMKDSLRITEGETFKRSLRNAKEIAKALEKKKEIKEKAPKMSKRSKRSKK